MEYNVSYSFQFVAPTKDEAKARVIAEFDRVIEAQPTHARDKDAAVANANAVIDLLEDNPSEDISVACNGYVSWRVIDGHEPNTQPLTGAAVTASACYVPRKQD